VTPGIRPGTNDVIQEDDQKRIASAYQAIRNGADYVVVGRPIRNSSDPVSVVKQIQDQIADAIA
jgi:orotidine-5'-phosphate decarboxylase